MTIYSAALTLILVMDPFGNISVFLSLLQSYDAQRRRRIIIREMVIAFGVLTVFLFFGKYILDGLHISQPALGISGGVILFLVAIRMIFPKDKEAGEQESKSEPIIVPLAVPLIAGPSAMAMVILTASQYPDRMLDWFAALAIAWAFTSAVLFSSDYLRKILGSRGIKAIERLMGMILTTLAVQMLLSGVQAFFTV